MVQVSQMHEWVMREGDIVHVNGIPVELAEDVLVRAGTSPEDISRIAAPKEVKGPDGRWCHLPGYGGWDINK